MQGCRFARLIGYDGGMRFRPRFSLKLLLLLTALLGSIVGWRIVVHKSEWAIRQQERDPIYTQLSYNRKWLKDEIENPWRGDESSIRQYQGEISRLEQRLKQLDASRR